MLVYRPDVVGVGRMFMVALKVPPAASRIRANAPDCVELFDRTPLPTGTKLRKYYFRSLRPAVRADIAFAHPETEVVVSIQIWSFADLRRFRKLKGVQLPRRWPLGERLPELKQGQTITPGALKRFWRTRGAPDRQRRDISVYKWLDARPHRPAAAPGGWLEVSDEQIWDLQPDSTVPRTHCVNLTMGCPVHGIEIYKHGSFYPWTRNVSFPYRWRLTCPVGGEEYPSNDFGAGDMTGGEFPDDGIGGACTHGGHKYGFIAEAHQAYCHQMLRVAPECADGYLATGDVRYVHKALVAFCRLAVEYAYLATMTQHRHRNRTSQVERLGPAPFTEGPCLATSGFTVYCIDQPAYQWAHAEAYDAIWPAIDRDRVRGGTGAQKRALWLRYGRARGHTHDDIMHIGLDAHQSEILGQLGYPRNAGYWERTWVTHNVARQIPFVEMTATAELFADAGPVHVAEAHAQGFVDRLAEGRGYEILSDNWQRRTVALIDVADDQFYCLDFYRIAGGTEHWWSFHVQEGEFAANGLELQRQEGGTLAGPDVPYGDDEWLGAAGCSRHPNYGWWWGPMFGSAHLYGVERGRPAGELWSADWELKDSDGLRFRLSALAQKNAEVVVCDGKSPVGGSPYEMKWVLMRAADRAPAKTQIMSTMELYRDTPVIKSVRRLAVSGQDEAGFACHGAVVELAGGGTDTVFAAADGSVLHTAAGGFEFSGRFGLFRERPGRQPRVVLIGGTRLTRNGVGIIREQAEYRARIVKVDRPTDTVTVAPSLPDIQATIGAYVYLTLRSL